MPAPGEVYERGRQLVAASRGGQWCPHTPHPRQAIFLALTCREALYGGAAGGGKSDALLMDALQNVHVPGYAAIVFRRTFAELALADALMDRAHQWLGNTRAHWDGIDRQWRFPLPPKTYGVGAPSLGFGYIDNESDKRRYQSAQFQYIGFDELTHFPENWYRYMLSRLRKPKGMAVTLKMRGASNPGSIGHRWVKRRFVDPETRRKGCAFVPATRRDNPFLDQESYAENLAELDEVTRRQLDEGDWEADGEGLVYYAYSPRLVDIDALPPRGVWTWLLSFDFGVTADNAACVLGWREHDPVTYIAECYRFQGEPSAAAEETRLLQAHYPFSRIVGDVGGLGKAFQGELVRRHSIPLEPAEKQNKLGFIKLLNGALEKGLIKVVAPSCADLIEEWTSLPWNEGRTKEAAGFPNHAADSGLYGWRASRSFLAAPPERPPARNSEEREHADEERMIEELEAEERMSRRRGRRSRSALGLLG